MSEDRDQAPSQALIAQLERSELVAVGHFTLDAAAARDKLAAYRLSDPQAFVLWIVEAAHLFWGCTGVEFHHRDRARESEIRLRGVGLSSAELRGVLDAAGARFEGLEREQAARVRARQLLALVVGTFSSLQLTRGRLSCSGLDECVEIAGDGSLSFVPCPLAEAGPPAGEVLCLQLQGADRGRLRGQHAWRARLLRARCRYATVPVFLDGERISSGFSLAEVPTPLVLRGPEGHLLALYGHSRARDEAVLLFIANGVLIEKVIDHELGAEIGRNFVALIQASDLPRDLGLSKLLRQEEYAARVGQLRQVARALPHRSWLPAQHLERYHSLLEVGAGFYMVLGLVLILPVFVSGPLALIMGTNAWYEHRKAKRALRGREGIAEVLEVLERELVPSLSQRRHRAQVRVHAIGERPFKATLVALRGSDLEPFVVGSRLRVCFDPGERSVVYLSEAEIHPALGPGDEALGV